MRRGSLRGASGWQRAMCSSVRNTYMHMDWSASGRFRKSVMDTSTVTRFLLAWSSSFTASSRPCKGSP